MSHNQNEYSIEFESPFVDKKRRLRLCIVNNNDNSTAATATSRIRRFGTLNFRSSRRGSVSAESYQPQRRPSSLATVNFNSEIVSENAKKAIKNNFFVQGAWLRAAQSRFCGMRKRPSRPGRSSSIKARRVIIFYIVEAGRYAAVEVDGKEVVQIGRRVLRGIGFNAMHPGQPQSKPSRMERCTPWIVALSVVIIDLAHEKRCKVHGFPQISSPARFHPSANSRNR